MTAALHAMITMTNLAHQGPLESRLPRHSPNPPQSLPLRKLPTAPIQWAHPSVPRTRQSAVCPPLQVTQATPQTKERSGTWGQWQWAHGSRDRGAGQQGSWEDCCVTGGGQAAEPTLDEALTNILGAYHHSQETMGQILAKLQETQRLQEGQYLGIREDLRDIHTTLVTMREVVAHQQASDTNHTEEYPSTDASGQEATQQEQQATSTLPPQKENHPQTVPAIQAEAREHYQEPCQEIRLS
ncbi:hypothetical protein NDU88_002997 [Pleurodeles waltl]|uniref:Uncharacterized protein n=1 Tax=Pleurodeles waltl TaxID=8319 RepID=A0AAV7WMS5_PLEWA|nr:hypothetical protein NDU88_002997 [Pleurodeles waltl]